MPLHSFLLTASLRNLLRQPGLSAVTVLTLALGIGATTAIFTLLNAIVLRPLPVPHPEELVALSTVAPDGLHRDQSFTWPMFQQLSDNQRVFASTFAWYRAGISNVEVSTLHYVTSLAMVSGSYYKTMQIAPQFGRLIDGNDVSRTGFSPAVAVIGYRAWQKWYGSDPAVVGKTIRIEGQPFTVVGVEPKRYTGLQTDSSDEVTIPLFSARSAWAVNPRDPKVAWLRAYGRLLPGTSFAQANAAIQAIWPSAIKLAAPPEYQASRLSRFLSRGIRLESAANGVSESRKRFSPYLIALQLLVTAVLLTACFNLASVFSIKAANGRHESGVRVALGARRRDLVKQPLVENLTLCLIGAALAVPFAYWTSKALLDLAWTGMLPSALNIAPDWRVLALVLTLSIAAALCITLSVVWQSARFDPLEAIKQNSRSISGASTRSSKFIVFLQIALSLALVSIALLLTKTLSSLQSLDTGYQREHLLTILLFPRISDGSKPSSSYYQQLAEELRQIPGVADASFSAFSPAVASEFLNPVSIPSSRQGNQAALDFVGPDFFRVTGIRLLSGREFTWFDTTSSKDIVMVSNGLAKRLFGDRNAIGRTVSLGSRWQGEEFTVVGVVQSASLWQVQSATPDAVFLPISRKFPDVAATLDISTFIDPSTIVIPAQRVVRSLRRDNPLRPATGDQLFEQALELERLTALLANFFAGSALLIAAIGIYGLTSFYVTTRTVEIGVRAAVGANKQQLVGLVLGQVLVVTAGGLVIGTAIAVFALKMTRGLLYGVSYDDPAILASAIGLLALVAVCSGALPAYRAANLDPMKALRPD